MGIYEKGQQVQLGDFVENITSRFDLALEPYREIGDQAVDLADVAEDLALEASDDLDVIPPLDEDRRTAFARELKALTALHASRAETREAMRIANIAGSRSIFLDQARRAVAIPPRPLSTPPQPWGTYIPRG